MTIRVLLVDDEYPSRQEMRELLGYFPEIEVLGEATTAREAFQLIKAVPYDAAFIDISLPGITGLELAQHIRETTPGVRVVFVTAHDSYAIEAFRVRAVDYLLKPVSEHRLAETVARLLHAKGSHCTPSGEAPSGGQNNGPEPLKWITVERQGAKAPIPVEEIVYISSEGYNVFVHTEQEQLPTRFTLQDLTSRLPQSIFFRCHRSYVVNMNQVKEIIPHLNGAYLLRMKNQARTEIPVSRSRVRELRVLFSLT